MVIMLIFLLLSTPACATHAKNATKVLIFRQIPRPTPLKYIKEVFLSNNLKQLFNYQNNKKDTSTKFLLRPRVWRVAAGA